MESMFLDIGLGCDCMIMSFVNNLGFKMKILILVYFN